MTETEELTPQKQARNHLSEYQAIGEKILKLKDTIGQIRAQLEQITPVLVQDKIQSSHNNDQMAEGIVKIIDLEDQIQELNQDREQLRTVYLSEIGYLSNARQRAILKRKYIFGMTSFEIAEGMSLTTRRVNQIHSEALELFDESIKLQFTEEKA
ncbi:MAG: sigma factor-like helix-turn-helix DNA-binding protein [Alphaproteobacteria bacterium]|nr:sigma factor-like helix-turn-helix DNA-binding protein [Alphaproteobacteria bacterium]